MRSSAKTRCIAGRSILTCHVFAEHRRYDVLRNVADDAIDRLAVLKENEAGNAGDLVLPGDARVVVGVQLDELRLAGCCAPRLFPRSEQSIRHGPHHGAQKSTSTGCVLFSTSESKVGSA